MHTQHVQTLVVELVESSQALHRRRDGYVPLLREASEEERSFGSGQHSLTCVDDRSLRLGDQVGGTLESYRVEGATVGNGDVASRASGHITPSEFGLSPPARNRLSKDTSGHVLG